MEQFVHLRFDEFKSVEQTSASAVSCSNVYAHPRRLASEFLKVGFQNPSSAQFVRSSVLLF